MLSQNWKTEIKLRGTIQFIEKLGKNREWKGLENWKKQYNSDIQQKTLKICHQKKRIVRLIIFIKSISDLFILHNLISEIYLNI